MSEALPHVLTLTRQFPASPGEEDITVGTFSVVDPPRRLEFAWDGLSPFGPAGETLVSLEFKDLSPGRELRLHYAFIHERSMIECKSGWECWQQSLAAFLDRQLAGD